MLTMVLGLVMSLEVTSGRISTNWGSPTPYFDVSVALVGADFSYGNSFSHDAFQLLYSPNPEFDPPIPGQEIGLGGVARLSHGFPLTFGEVAYYASGEISVVTPTVFASTLVSTPFTLSGQIHGQRVGDGAVLDFDVFGSGVMTAWFFALGDRLEIQSLDYELRPEPAPEAIPEPATWLLLGAGLAGMFTARRRITEPKP